MKKKPNLRITVTLELLELQSKLTAFLGKKSRNLDANFYKNPHEIAAEFVIDLAKMEEAKNKCDHPNEKLHPDGHLYCPDCGIDITEVMNTDD